MHLLDGSPVAQMCGLGTFAEHTTVDVRSAVKVDRDLPLERVCLLSCAVGTGYGSAVHMAAIEPGDAVVVMGCGGVGMNAVQGAAHAGASHVLAVDPVAFKREQAPIFGATHAFADVADAAEFARSVTNGQGADVAIVTIGTGFATKVVMTSIISFFPTLVNMMKGLDSVDPLLVELFKSVHASRSEVMWKLRWPSALPFLFAGLRITASASVVGAIIVEWIGADSGLGYMIINSTYQFNTPLLWASLVASSILVLASFGLVSVAERFVVPWNRVPDAVASGV